jgi:hypothetical protein
MLSCFALENVIQFAKQSASMVSARLPTLASATLTTLEISAVFAFLLAPSAVEMEFVMITLASARMVSR